MKIRDIETSLITIPLVTEFKTALRTVSSIENVLVTVVTDTSLPGFGSAAPATVITGETISSILGAIAVIRDNLMDMDIENHEALFQRLNHCIIGNPSAKAAVDMAIFDLLAKSFDTPLYKLLGGLSGTVETDYTISLNSPGQMADESREKVAEGFSTLKIKVGSDPELDIDRLTAVHNGVGDKVRIRIDANQGWSPKEAINVCAELKKRALPIELVEQPVKALDFEGLKSVCRASPFPVFGDESIFTPRDALSLIQMNGVDGINIKLMKCGGIYNGLQIAAIAESAGIPCMIGSMMECHISVTAAAHFAAAKTVITKYDLDAPLFCSSNPADGGMVYNKSQVCLPDTPGLGIKRIMV